MFWISFALALSFIRPNSGAVVHRTSLRALLWLSFLEQELCFILVYFSLLWCQVSHSDNSAVSADPWTLPRYPLQLLLPSALLVVCNTWTLAPGTKSAELFAVYCCRFRVLYLVSCVSAGVRGSLVTHQMLREQLLSLWRELVMNHCFVQSVRGWAVTRSFTNLWNVSESSVWKCEPSE